jgi:dTDP-4-amino-4,6-dideoxygalactose transaminase
MIVRKDAPFSRDQLVNHLESNGIDTRSLFQSMPTQCRGFESLGYKLGQFPNAELCGTNGLHIGIHQDITNDDVSYVLEVIGEFIRQKC